MKSKIYLSVLAFLMVIFSLKGQGCLPEGITFSTQEQIDNFAVDYPGCTEIEGNVIISESQSSSIENLSGLSQINSISGNLYIYSNAHLENLSPLSNISTVEGTINISGCSVLTSLDGLENAFASLHQNLFIANNSNLNDLSALIGLTEFEGLLNISNNQHLTSLTGLENLTSIDSSLVITKNDNLVNLNSLAQLNYIGGFFKLEYNDILINLSGLNNLISIGEYISILGNNALEDLSGLESLTTIGGSLKIISNASLESISGIQNINSTTIQDNGEFFPDLVITNNPQLTECSFGNICEKIVELGSKVSIYGNSTNCNGIDKIAVNCNTVSENGIIITNQQQIDAFQTDYSNITKVNGNMWIIESTDNNITHLTGLEQLDSIQGFLRIIGNANLPSLSGLDNLTLVNEDFIVNSNYALEYFNGLENLVSIGGTFEVYSNASLMDFSGLEGLQQIGQDLIITNNYVLNDCTGLISLNSIGNELEIRNNNFFLNFIGLEYLTALRSLTVENNNFMQNLEGLTGLNTMEGNVNIIENDNLTNLEGLNNLQMLNGNLDLYNNDSLESLLGLNSINSIGGYLNVFSSPLSDISSLSNLTSIGDYFDISYTDLTLFTGLENLTAVGGAVSIRATPVESLQPLSNLSYIGENLILEGTDLQNFEGLGALSTLGGNLFLYHNPNFSQLSGLNSLYSIGGELEISRNQKLKTLNGLEGIYSIDGPLIISRNDSLTTLAGIENIDPESIYNIFNIYLGYNDIEIFGNPMLTECNVLSICDAIGVYNKKTHIEFNATGCNAEQEIDCSNYGIQGYVFFDFNQNQQQDETEVGVQNIEVSFSPSGQTVFSNQNGRYLQLCDSGTVYTISLLDNPDWQLTTDSSSYTIFFEPGNEGNTNNNFGLYPTFSQHTGTLNLSSDQTRCNSDVEFYLRYQNTGTYLESGQVSLTYDPSSAYVSASPEPDEVNEGNFTLTWNYDSLYPFQYKDISLTLAMPDENSTGEPINFYTEIFRDSMNTNVLLDDYLYSPIVLCSFDPNDKLVMPPGAREQNYTLHDEKLTYTIRFQNTGNAEAIDIRILDTLDANLDTNTFRVINSSFPVQTSLAGHDVEFFFNNIWLPDSNSNEPASHGFVTYEIKPVEGLEDYTEIENTAHIIFDFNPPIVTNTTLNTMVEMIPTGTKEIEQSIIAIIPNPASEQIRITARQWQIEKVLIYNQLGQLVMSSEANILDISDLAKGMYLLNVTADGRVMSGKLVVE